MTRETEERVPVVGIGASAGGVEALELLFRAMPADVAAAFVVVTHLSPDRESMLPTILQRYTDIPVVVADDGVRLEVGRIYVMPPAATLTIRGGRLSLVSLPSGAREAHPVDVFFTALALDLGEHAAAIVLSGNDGDGTLGVKAIKEGGGLTMAQVADGSAPKYPGMPQTAIASGMIDLAIPVQDMPAQIVSFVAGLGVLERLSHGEHPGELQRFDEFRTEVYGLLEAQLGHDFSGYKTRTFNRRVQRRIQLHQLDGVETYVARLRKDPSEIPALFEGKGHEDTVRVWVPACATGEEVYSIAILMREHMDTLIERPRVQIFATDIDERSLEAARAARYPEPLLEYVTPERRRRFFTSDGASFVVIKEVRELCIFSPHSLIRDPPFSRMDLVSCRNLLIYIAPNLQGQIIPLFHYSLKPRGFLFLGTSENVGTFSDLFTPVDRKQRIYRARDNAGTAMRLPVIPRVQPSELMSEIISGTKLAKVQSLREEVDERVAERFSPAHVVINSESDIVLYSTRTGKYLEAAPGIPSRQLLAMARKGVRLELRGMIREAVAERRRVERHNLSVELDDGRQQMVNVIVEPLEVSAPEPLFIVLFVDAGPPLDQEQGVNFRPGDQGDVTSALERELVETRERLQSMVEEYETALEELKSSNEELVSVNEELQSTNEELEASKEELQSLNEELQTVNTELGHKIDELDQSNSDLRNLFDTSKIASIFVRRDLTIRNFTPLAAELFNLVPSDRGRSLTIFTFPLKYPDFLTHLARTAENGEPIEMRVAHDSGEVRYLVRIQPYRGASGMRDGATVTFVDITSLSV